MLVVVRAAAGTDETPFSSFTIMEAGGKEQLSPFAQLDRIDRLMEEQMRSMDLAMERANRLQEKAMERALEQDGRTMTPQTYRREERSEERLADGG